MADAQNSVPEGILGKWTLKKDGASAGECDEFLKSNGVGWMKRKIAKSVLSGSFAFEIKSEDGGVTIAQSKPGKVEDRVKFSEDFYEGQWGAQDKTKTQMRGAIVEGNFTVIFEEGTQR